MQERSIPVEILLSETARFFSRFLWLLVLLAVLFAAMYFLLGSPKMLAVVVAVFFTLLLVAAPIASSLIRARRRLGIFTAAGGTTIIFCFSWGALVAAGFIATLQLWQGMGATLINYLAAMASVGAACAAMAVIPNGR